MRLAITIAALLLLLSCDKSSQLGYAGTEQVSIAYLKSLCRGDIYDIATDLTLSGTVIATDWLVEYHKSIVVLDATGGIEINIDKVSLFRQIPVYGRVTVFCNGLTLGRAGGSIVLGAHPTGDYPVDGIDASLLERYIRIDSTTGESVAPAEKRIDEISVGDIGKYVIFRDVSIDDTGNGKWCDFDAEQAKYVSTIRRIADNDGNTFAIHTLGICHYAAEALPTGQFSVAGIIDYAGNEFRLRIINHAILE